MAAARKWAIGPIGAMSPRWQALGMDEIAGQGVIPAAEAQAAGPRAARRPVARGGGLSSDPSAPFRRPRTRVVGVDAGPEDMPGRPLSPNWVTDQVTGGDTAATVSLDGPPGSAEPLMRRVRSADLLPIDQRPGYDANRLGWKGGSAAVGRPWGSNNATQLGLPGLPRSMTTGPEAILGRTYRPAPEREPSLPPSERLAALVEGRIGSASFTDPALMTGSFALGTARPGRVRRVVTAEDLGRVRGEGGIPDVYRELVNQAERTDVRLQDLMQEAPGDRRIGYAGGEPAMRTPISYVTALPDERMLPGGRTPGEEPGHTVPVTYHLGGGKFTTVNVDPALVVENRAIPVEQRESAFDSDSYREITLGAAAQEALRGSKTRMTGASLIDRAAEEGRWFAAQGGYPGTQIGVLRVPGANPAAPQPAPASSPTFTPVYMPRDYEGDPYTVSSLRPAYGYTGYTLPEPEVFFEDAVRVGAPMSRDPDILRRGLAEALAQQLPVQAKTVGNTRNVANAGRLRNAIENGMIVAPLGGGALSAEDVVARLSAMRGSTDASAAPVLQVSRPSSKEGGSAKVLHTLVPEKDLGGNYTGRYLVADWTDEIGPAALLSNSKLRKAGEAWEKEQGIPREDRGLIGLASALAAHGGYPRKHEPQLPAAANPMNAMAARAILSDSEFEALGDRAALLQRAMAGARTVNPGNPFAALVDAAGAAPVLRVPPGIAAADSYDRVRLEQGIYDALNGQVPMDVIRSRLAYSERPAFPGKAVAPEEMPRIAMVPLAGGAPVTPAEMALPSASNSLPQPFIGPAMPPTAAARASTERVIQPALFLRQRYRTTVAEDGTVRREPLGGPIPFGDGGAMPSAYAPSAFDGAALAWAARVAEKAAKSGRKPTVVRDMVVRQGELPLDYTPPAGQLEMFPAGAPAVRLTPAELGRRLKAVEMADEGAELWASGSAPQLYSTPDALAARGPDGERLYPVPADVLASTVNAPGSPGQLPIRFMDIDPARVQVSAAEIPVGRAAGPYAGSEYYGLGDAGASRRAAMSARGQAAGFDYQRMAGALGAEPGSPEHERAMLQMMRRVAARNASASPQATEWSW